MNLGAEAAEFIGQGKEVFGFQSFSRIGDQGCEVFTKRFFQRQDGLVLRLKGRFHRLISGVGQSYHASAVGGYGIERPVDEYGDVTFPGKLQHGVFLSGIGYEQGARFEKVHGQLKHLKTMMGLAGLLRRPLGGFEHAGQRGRFRVFGSGRTRVGRNAVVLDAA